MSIARLFTQTVSLETWLGANSQGDVFAATVPVSCFIDSSTKLVRDNNGREVVSTTTLYAPLPSSPSTPPAQGQFSLGSKVTVNGRTARVLGVEAQNSAGPSSSFHTQVSLT